MGTRRSDLQMHIEAIADEEVGTVGPEATIGVVANTMVSQSGGGRSVVVEANDRLVGIITDRDLIERTLTPGGAGSLVSGERTDDDVCAEDVMTPDPLMVTPDAEIPRVLRRMNEAAARHVPVVDDGTVVGMVTLDDLVRHVAGESAHVAAQLDNLAGVIRAESGSG